MLRLLLFGKPGFIERDILRTNNSLGRGIIDKVSRRVTGIPNKDTFPGLRLQFLATRVLYVHKCRASKHTKVRQVRRLRFRVWV